MKKLVLAVDCDDVLLNAQEYLVSTYNARYGTSVEVMTAHTSNNPDWQADRDETLRRLTEIQNGDMFGALPPRQDAVEVIARLALAHDLHLVTARPPELSKVTMSMLERHFPDCFKDVMHVGPDSSKGEVCHAIRADVIIDDSMKHLEVAKSCGVRHLIWFGSYAWQDKANLPDGMTACDDWYEVEGVVNAIATQ